MSRHVVVGTAGHVDHGKTALVKALTGVETDRWEEERRRGITIDIGFAPLALEEGLDASVVDVPGHEDFIRNMVAGATGVDVALLVVAADEGVMPQTIEHLAILDFLGVRAGVVAITKCDLAEPEWLELVRVDATERTAASGIAWEAVVPVSAVTNAGLEELRAALARAARAARERSAADLFRLPVDRVFSVAGAGTVVTGTAWSGTVKVGEEVTVFPGGRRARVRGVEIHGTARERAEPGRRTALALAGLERGAASRGSSVVGPGAWRETTTIDAIVTLLPEARPLTQRSRVRVHLGTVEVMARVTPEGGAVTPETQRGVRLRLEAPLVARWGDRLVLRSYSPVTTIGGGMVVDPWPDARPRRPRDLAMLAGPDAVARAKEALVRRAGRGLPLDELSVRLGIQPDIVPAVREALEGNGAAFAGGRAFDASVADAVRERITSTLAAHHRDDPLAAGMPREALRRAVTGRGSPALVDHVLETLAGAGKIVVEGANARLSDFHPRIDDDLAAAAGRLRTALDAAGSEGGTPTELTRETGVPEQDVRRLLDFLVRDGTACRVGPERYYGRAPLEGMVARTLELVAERGGVSPAEVRDRLGLTRKYLIPFLEWMDANGYTVRVGDARRAGPNAPKLP